MLAVDGRGDARRDERRAQRNVAARQALGDAHDVGYDAVVFERAPGAAAPGAAHHFVGDQQHVVLAAHGLDGLCVARGRGHHAARRADDGFEDECGDRLRSQRQNGALELGGQMNGQALRGYAVGPPVHVRRGNERDIEQAPFEGAAPLGEAGDRQRAQGIAMPGTLPRDEAALVHEAARRKMLKRDLHRGLDGFRSAARVHDVREPAAAQAQHRVGQTFERRAREQISIGIRDLIELPHDGRIDLRVGMPEAEHRRAA